MLPNDSMNAAIEGTDDPAKSSIVWEPADSLINSL